MAGLGAWADARPARVAAWLLRRANGRIMRPWHRRVLLLTTRGRRSGLVRTVSLQCFPDGHDMVVIAANGAMPNHPGWYHNLKAHPDADVEICDSVREPGEQLPESGGRKIAVRAEELSAEQAAAFWPRVLQIARQYEVSEADRSRHPAPTARPGARRGPGAHHMTGHRAPSDHRLRECGPMRACTASKFVAVSDLLVCGVVHAALWYSLKTPPSTFRRCTGALSGTMTCSSGSGGRWWRDCPGDIAGLILPPARLGSPPATPPSRPSRRAGLRGSGQH